MNKFIAYFDYLGFKQFIENNDYKYQRRIIDNNFRDMELALSRGKTKDGIYGRIADISNSNIRCINFSDTVVFWTNDDTEASLAEILEVTDKFNWQAIGYCFPVRGSLVYGEIEYVDFKQENNSGGLYNINSVFGKGLVMAHEKAEKQHWAGNVIDHSFISELSKRGYNIEDFLRPYAKRYKVPYKPDIEGPKEYVMCLVEGKLKKVIEHL